MRELVRKFIHICFGLGIAGMILYLDHTMCVQLLITGFFIGMILIELLSKGCTVPLFSPLVAYADRNDSLPGRGALYFTVSALVCVLLFPAQVAATALVTVAVLDGVSGIIGTRYGRTRIYNGKSLEGTVSGIAVTVFCLLPLLPAAGALLVSVVAGVIELVSPLDDNLVIPVSVCVLLTLVPFSVI